MIKIYKLISHYFPQFLIIVLFGSMVFMSRNAICRSYNDQVDLNSKRYINKIESKSDKEIHDFFVNKTKEDFAKKVNDMIIYFVLGFVFLAIQQSKLKGGKINLKFIKSKQS